MKKCFKCKIEKSITGFYSHKQMADGHLNKCKECTKKDVQNRYNDPVAIKKIVEYERRRFQNPERKKKLMEYQKRRRHRNPEKDKARRDIGRAIKKGVVRRRPCDICGNINTEAHHTNYSANTFQWLCRKHHLMAENKKSYT